MELAGVRELKNRLSHYLFLIKKGEKVVVTERGTPIAILHALDNTKVGMSREKKLAILARKGMIRLPVKKKFDTAFKPVPIKGKPVSKIVIEDRR